MTIKELQEIIALNIDAAEAGSLQAQGQVIEAQAEIERLERVAEEAIRDEWCEGAGVPVDPFTEALEAKREADERAERAEFGGFTREELTDFSCLTDEEMAGEW